MILLLRLKKHILQKAKVQTDLSSQSISDMKLGFIQLTGEKYRMPKVAKDKDFIEDSLQSDNSKVKYLQVYYSILLL